MSIDIFVYFCNKLTSSKDYTVARIFDAIERENLTRISVSEKSRFFRNLSNKVKTQIGGCKMQFPTNYSVSHTNAI